MTLWKMRVESGGDIVEGVCMLVGASVLLCTIVVISNTELTESQQMEQLHVPSEVHLPNLEHSEPPKSAVANIQDACVQTEPLAALPSTQPAFTCTGYPAVTVGHQYDKEYLDPAPILPHMIPADALEGTCTAKCQCICDYCIQIELCHRSMSMICMYLLPL